MPELVALDLPGGIGFVDALRAIWDTGDAVAPIDPRLPASARAELLRALRPTRIVSSDGEISKLDDGVGVEVGDALVVASAGSRGEPRGVVHTFASLQANATASARRLGIDRARHAWLSCLSLAHIGGFSVVSRAVLTDTRVVILPRFSADALHDAARAGQGTHVSVVETMLRRIEAPLFECVLLGGAPPPPELEHNVVPTYGLTETASGVVFAGQALDGVDVALGTGVSGQGSAGEVLVRGPVLARCYRDGELPLIAGPDDAGGWFGTGDAGRWASDGRLEALGPLNEEILSGGVSLRPEAIERLLGSHDGVAEVAVWRRADPELSHRVVAFVVPTATAHPPTLEELQALAAGTPGQRFPLHEVVVVEQLPRSALGKIRRHLLR